MGFLLQLCTKIYPDDILSLVGELDTPIVAE